MTSGCPGSTGGAAERRPEHPAATIDRTVRGARGAIAAPDHLASLAGLQMLVSGGNAADAAAALSRPRWTLGAAGRPVFDSWPRYPAETSEPLVRLEEEAPTAWHRDLAAHGHSVHSSPTSGDFGHAQIALVDETGSCAAAEDPRAEIGAAVAW